MPRRNKRPRFVHLPPPIPEPDYRSAETFEEMARELVWAGKRTILILDYPHRFTQNRRTGATA